MTISPFMMTFEQAETLNAFTDQLFGYSKHNALVPNGPRLDLSKPNLHDSKKDFLSEKATVEQTIAHSKGFIDLFLDFKHEENSGHSEMKTRITIAVNKFASETGRRKAPESADDLVLKNVLETGFFYNSLFVMLELVNVYQQRLDELNDQEKKFWNVTSRPPNYYARTIALRFARMYAHETKTKPTFGISREGSHPSTDYGRALEHVFTILNIKAKVRNPAEWAIAQLTDSDLNRPANSLMGGLLGMRSYDLPTRTQTTTREKIAELLAKRSDS